jgi:hypothetical protein
LHGGAAVELLEHGEQHQGDHQPNSDFREPLIVHRGSFSGSKHFSPIKRLGLPRQMGSILCQSSPCYGLQITAIGKVYRHVRALRHGIGRRFATSDRYRPKGFGRFVRDALGLIGLTTETAP